MHPLIERNRRKVEMLCARHGVKRLEAFGSILREDFDAENSDIDILVEFTPAVATSFDNFLNLKEALESVLGRPVDLLELSAIRNRRLRYYIEQDKTSIYEAA
jgi:predicted nucleotidyltransferase